MLKWLATVTLIVLGFIIADDAHAASNYTVQKGDTLYRISKKHTVTVNSIKVKNHLKSDRIYVGQKLVIPDAIAPWDRTHLAKIIAAETGSSEPFEGKVLVGSVVLNRVDSPSFPNSIYDVIYQKTRSGYAFTPVGNGAIYRVKPTALDYAAADEAVARRGTGNGSLYFNNPKTSKSTWFATREVTVRIGSHTFYR